MKPALESSVDAKRYVDVSTPHSWRSPACPARFLL